MKAEQQQKQEARIEQRVNRLKNLVNSLATRRERADVIEGRTRSTIARDNRNNSGMWT
jgi:hypothetical protein